MRLAIPSLAVLAAGYLHLAFAVDPTDEYRDADVEQTSYLPNHNMDPAVVDSSTFGLLWKIPFNSEEQFYAKPLTYTPLAGGSQLLFLASSQNWIRTLDAKTGALINSRQVHTPFLQSDIGCTDIPYNIGIIGTPTIDPTTDIVYFYAKTYIPNYRVSGNTGTANGVYYFHAVNINTLADVYPPILIDGSVADNAPQKYFVGGVTLQRPSLVQIGTVVYGAFGGHCDLFNYTGLVIGIDINKAKIVTQWAVESGPLATQTNVLLQNGGGGQGGIWMSGMGIVSDGERLFFVTGNGDGHQNQGAPASGSSGCQTLGEATVNLAVDSSTGVLSLSDYFQPYDYQNSDADDQDFGSGGIVLLDPATFSGGGIEKMALTAGKNGKVYVLNANNLGGYKLGTAQTDNVIQTITTGESVFGAGGSYPLEGGYIYFTPVGYATSAYKLGFTASGTPQFSVAGVTNEISTGRVGVGIPTITTLNNQPGTAILWMTDPNAGLRAWYAVPENGVLVNIPLPQVGGANKFQRPAFGDGRVYVTDTNGILYALGAPVNLPLNCTSPVNFGNVALGSKESETVTCKANIAITAVNGATVGDTNFVVSNSSLPTGPLAVGATFSFPVTWDLTDVVVTNTANASSGNVKPGIKSTPLTLYTTNGAAGYATEFPVSLIGTEVSSTPYLDVTPNTVDFGGVVILNNANVSTISSVITIANDGLQPMTILGYAYTPDDVDSNPTWFNSTSVNGVWNLGYGFSATGVPAVGSVIPAQSSVSFEATFDPINGTQTYTAWWNTYSDGGNEYIFLEGIASTAPIANFSISNGEGGWLPQTNLLMDFGDVAPGSSSSRQIRLCNQGGSSLEIDKSKPPNGVFHISDPTELEETQQIPPGECAYGTVLMVANEEDFNEPDLVVNNTWTLNTNDLNFGVHIVEIVGTVVSVKVGPLNSTGQTVYEYLGCFHESTSGPRLFPTEGYAAGNNNDNNNCQNACYSAGKYAFAGTEYGTECWCGNTPPPLANQDTLNIYCNFACPANSNDTCGAANYLSVYYDPTKYTAGANPALYGPQTVQTPGNYVYKGCYSEATTGRALSGKTPTAPAGGFTIELCMAACQGYTYFGMEYSNQCYCGNTINAGSVNQTSSVPSTNGCSMLCTGNQLEYCGGSARLDLYMLNTSAVVSTSTVSTSSLSSSSLSSSTGSVSTSTSSISTLSTSSTSSSSSVSSTTSTSSSAPTPTGPITVTNLPGWTYLGCYTEATNTRALNGLLLPITAANTSVENCAAACSKYTYFGVEYSQECYCGNVINAGSVNETSSVPSVSGCNMVCAANTTEYCGGRTRLNMYQAVPAVSSSSSSTVSMSSSSSSSSSSSVSSSITVSTFSGTSLSITTSSSTSSTTTSASSSSSQSTSTTSTSSVLSSTSTSSSVTSTLPSSTSASSSVLSSSTCSTSCLTSVTMISVTASTTSTVSVTSSSTSSAASWTGTRTAGQMIGSWEYLGCALEVAGRTLTGSSYSSNTLMTIEACQAFCTSNNYALAGVEYAQQCYCANVITTGATLGQTGCNMACSGNSAETCGGNSCLNLFNNTAYVYPGNPPVVNSYVYQGCYHEPANGRLLSSFSYSDSVNMTVESCTSFCNAKIPAGGYAGVEYGAQCYCAATLPTTGTLEPNSTCNMLCSGNDKEYCGGSSLLNVYEYQAPPTRRSRAKKAKLFW